MSTSGMQYELAGSKVPSRLSTKQEARRLRELDINKMSSSAIVKHLVIKHKFGLLMTFTIVYVTFSTFGALIVSLVESIK